MCATGLNTICKRTSNKQRRRLEVQVHDGVGVVHDGVGVVHDGVLLADLVVLLVDVPLSTSAQRYTLYQRAALRTKVSESDAAIHGAKTIRIGSASDDARQQKGKQQHMADGGAAVK